MGHACVGYGTGHVSSADNALGRKDTGTLVLDHTHSAGGVEGAVSGNRPCRNVRTYGQPHGYAYAVQHPAAVAVYLRHSASSTL